MTDNSTTDELGVSASFWEWFHGQADTKELALRLYAISAFGIILSAILAAFSYPWNAAFAFGMALIAGLIGYLYARTETHD